MLVALSVSFIISYLSVIITRGRTSTLELKLLTNTNSHFPLGSVIYHFHLPQCYSMSWKNCWDMVLGFYPGCSPPVPSYRWCRIRLGRFTSCLWRRTGQFVCLPLAKWHLLKALGGGEWRSLVGCWCPATAGYMWQSLCWASGWAQAFFLTVPKITMT